MPLLFDPFRQQINVPKTRAVFMAAALISVGMVSDAGQTPVIPVRDASAAMNAVIIPQIENAAATPQSENATATRQSENATANPQTKDASANPQPENAAANPQPENAAANPQTKNAPAILQTTSTDNWQYWQYCLAPSYTEHKIYFSAPIPMRKIVGSAEFAFDKMLSSAGFAHDTVQCPIAPNNPTLRFRQKYAIKFNERIGNATISLNWEPIVD